MRISDTISKIMTGNHSLIEILLTAFKNNLGKDLRTAERLFDEFRWELEKHIFVEERVIFKFCNLPKSETCKIIQDLVEEHGTMLGMLNEIGNDLVNENEVDISRFQDLLTDHRNIEEKNLYPKLDQQLDKKQKEMIISRINEIPVKRGADI